MVLYTYTKFQLKIEKIMNPETKFHEFRIFKIEMKIHPADECQKWWWISF